MHWLSLRNHDGIVGFWESALQVVRTGFSQDQMLPRHTSRHPIPYCRKDIGLPDRSMAVQNHKLSYLGKANSHRVSQKRTIGG